MYVLQNLRATTMKNARVFVILLDCCRIAMRCIYPGNKISNRLHFGTQQYLSDIRPDVKIILKKTVC